MKIVTRTIHTATGFILARLFPKTCAVCSREGEWLCAACAPKMPISENNRCHFCLRPAVLGICPDCRYYGLNALWANYDYSFAPLAKLIKNYKYHFVRSLDEPLGSLLVKGWELFQAEADSLPLRPHWIERIDLMVPIPLYKRRYNWRGFNQSYELAAMLKRVSGITLDAAGLQRIRHTSAQAGLSARVRRKNLEGAFRWRGKDLHGLNVLLIDDVLTTVSTLLQAAKALKQAGAKNVIGFALAKD